MLPDNRAGALQPELDGLRERYAEAWGVDLADVPPLGDDHLRRARIALSDEKAGLTQDDRIQAAFAAIRGHKREASKDGSQLCRELRGVFPVAYVNGRSASNRLDWDRYMGFVRAGRRNASRADTESPAEIERRQREAEIERERAEKGDEGRGEKVSEGRAEFKRAAAEARKS
jgi:hypothetical protein